MGTNYILFKSFSRVSLKQLLEYRISTLLWIGSDFLNIALLSLLWGAIFSSSPSPDGIINGFTYGTMILYIITNAWAAPFVWYGAGNVMYHISNDIKNGTIGVQLIKPLHYLRLQFFNSLAGLVVFFVPLTIVYGALYIFVMLNQGIDVTIFHFPLAVLAVFIGFLVSFLFNAMFGLLSFVTHNSFGLVQLKNVVFILFAGTLMPLTFYPEWLQTITYFVPFRYIIYTPSALLSGAISTNEALWQILIACGWVLLLFVCLMLLWRAMIKRVVVFGG